ILSAAVVKVARTWKDRPVTPRRRETEAGQPGQKRSLPVAESQQGVPPEAPPAVGGPESEETLIAAADEDTAELRSTGAMPPFEMVNRAQQLVQEKRYKAALALAKQGFRNAQNRQVKARALFTIGRIHEELGNNKKSVMAYRILLRKFQDQPEFTEKARDRLRTLR
ncbi:MAG: hypothetical protein AB1633_04630, partial [Elusimicrobiota bacterium]